jgi:hypothetical protein
MFDERGKDVGRFAVNVELENYGDYLVGPEKVGSGGANSL